jgi:triacylglycerol lipase
MSDPDATSLKPYEAAQIATNAYFALGGWSDFKTEAQTKSDPSYKQPALGGAARGDVLASRVSGNAQMGKRQDTSALAGTATDLQLHKATTGLSVESGFGYTMRYKSGDQSHLVIAIRGTRPEMAGKPDVLTDLRAAMTPFGSFGNVHKGFKNTLESMRSSLEATKKSIGNSELIHCVGHSLGGGVATLIAAELASRKQPVKLYTFGSPRVGAYSAHSAIEEAIGARNIYRVAHDLDPIALIAPYPYIHVNPSPSDDNNMTLPSPSGSINLLENHDMALYMASMKDRETKWAYVRTLKGQVDFNNALLAKWLLHPDNKPGWVQVASAKTLNLLFRLFEDALRDKSESVMRKLTAIDLLCEMLVNGLYKAKQLGDQVMQLLGYAAQWAGMKLAKGAEFTAEIIRVILAKMLAAIRAYATIALQRATRNLVPIALGTAAAWSAVRFMPL